jgi:hypothetical protein
MAARDAPGRIRTDRRVTRKAENGVFLEREFIILSASPP